MKEFNLSIIIPCYNNCNFTKSAVQDLLKLPNDIEIIVVDNASTDETCKIINELLDLREAENAQLIYIGCHKNLGFGRANNKAYKHSRGKNILFLNNDIRVKNNFTNWPKEIIKLCQEGYLVSANGGLLNSEFGFVKEINEMVDSELFYLSGWCIAGSRETFDKLILNYYSDDEIDQIKSGRAWGPWNEKFFAYFEDPDISWRAKEINIPLKLIQVPIHHFGQMTSKKLNFSNMYTVSKEIFKEIWNQKLKKI